MIKFDSKQAKAAEASDNEQENDDEKYFDRLDAGLFTLQTVSLILLDVCSNTYSALQRTSKLFSMKLKQERVSKIAAQYQQNLGADAQEEAGRVDRLMAKLSSLEKDLHA